MGGREGVEEVMAAAGVEVAEEGVVGGCTRDAPAAGKLARWQ